MIVYSASDIGLVRSSNQDCCNTGAFSDGNAFAVVCDGMGGANGGCTASSVATQTISQRLSDLYRPEMSDDEIREIMELAVSEANLKVYDMAQNDSFLYGMGTTVVCAVVRGTALYVVHAGDSRAYLFEDGTLRRLTTDHSMVQELVSAGQITEEQARQHPNRNIITRALGVDAYLATDYNRAELGAGSLLLICTDGLSGYFSDGQLCSMIAQTPDDMLAEELIKAAKAQGGSDNITVAVISQRQ